MLAEYRSDCILFVLTIHKLHMSQKFKALFHNPECDVLLYGTRARGFLSVKGSS